MDDALKNIRDTAHGVEVDEALLSQFPIKKKTELTIPRDGEEGVHIYIYEPLGFQEGGPVIINMHGGGFVKPYRGRDIVFSQDCAFNTDCLYIDVDYKTAPERMFPYALEEGYAVTRYVYEHADELRIDRDRIILMGESAGANLIAGICLLNKDRKNVKIRELIMCYPPLDLKTDPSEKISKDAPPEELERAVNGQKYNAWYARPEEWGNKLVSPVYASREDLMEFPETMIFTGGKDALGPEAELFALHLIQAGVPVTMKQFPEAKHGFLVRRNAGFEIAEKMIFDRVGQIRNEKTRP